MSYIAKAPTSPQTFKQHYHHLTLVDAQIPQHWNMTSPLIWKLSVVESPIAEFAIVYGSYTENQHHYHKNKVLKLLEYKQKVNMQWGNMGGTPNLEWIFVKSSALWFFVA